MKKEYTEEHVELVKAGLPNLIKHISNGTKHGVPVIVAINIHAYVRIFYIDTVYRNYNVAQFYPYFIIAEAIQMLKLKL